MTPVNHNLPYSESAKGYRRRLPGIYSTRAEGFSKMVRLDADIKVTRDSTCFVGRDKTSNKLVMVNGDNTNDQILGFLGTGKFESHLIKAHKPIDYDQFNLNEGDEYPLWNNPGTEYCIMIEGADAAERETNAAALGYGQMFDLFVDTDGTQKMKSSVAGTQVIFLQALGAGYVTVSIASPSAAV